MIKIKALILVAVIAFSLLLSGCGSLTGEDHVHNLKWVNGSFPKLAFQFCTKCLRVVDFEDIYSDRVQAGVSDSGSEPLMDPIIGHITELDKGIFDYNEEIEITLKLLFWYPYYINISDDPNGELRVQIAESEYYEIIGDSEYVVEYFNSEKANELGSLSFKFTIKATKACSTLECVKFMVNAPFNENYFSCLPDLEYYYQNPEEFCLCIDDLGFMTDSQGIILGNDATKVFYDSINREYLSGNLSKDDYIDKVYEYVLEDSVVVSRNFASGNIPYFNYMSKNIRADLYITNDRDRLLSLFDNKENAEQSRTEIAKKLVEILYTNDFISSEEYNRELQYIEDREIKLSYNVIGYKYIPIKKYFQKHKIDYVYEESGDIEYRR